jgi:hypothetical protein
MDLMRTPEFTSVSEIVVLARDPTTAIKLQLVQLEYEMIYPTSPVETFPPELG